MKRFCIIILALVLGWPSWIVRPALSQVSTPISITSSLVVSWTAVSSADSYTVKRSLVNGGPYTTIASGITAVTYIDSTVALRTTYYYVVAAVNAIGSSPDSVQASGTTP